MTQAGRLPYNVLFLCTGNSARSIFAECAMNRWGQGRFKAYSAGSHPLGHIHPVTLATLQELKYSTEGLRSKSWDEFGGVTDPAAYVGPEEKQRSVFIKAYMELDTRIELFLNLPLDSINSMSLQQRLDDIGRS